MRKMSGFTSVAMANANRMYMPEEYCLTGTCDEVTQLGKLNDLRFAA